MNLLLNFHRRFLLRGKLGVRWRAVLTERAGEHGTPVDGSSISHVISGDWRSKKIERLIADALGLPASEVFPEYHSVTKTPQQSAEERP
jgi:lambda repressor-like predicted transcriptional regulator